MAPVRQQHVLVGIETDPTFYHGERARRPALLDTARTGQVLAQIATDLAMLLPASRQCTLSVAGALFDQAQVLRPGLPVFHALETLRQSVVHDQSANTGLLAFGIEDVNTSPEELQPDPGIASGSLQLLPVLISYPADSNAVPAATLESLFATGGQLSSATVGSLENHFQIAARQARFMTVSQLADLLRRQLENYGLLGLWELLDAAMGATVDVLEVRTGPGPSFKWQDGAVHGFFESFDWWANHGSGAGGAASGQGLQTAYAAWTREYRRYQTGLSAHGITLAQHLPGHEGSTLEGSFLLEESTMVQKKSAIPVTEHSTEDLGTVAVTVVNGRRQMNFYPLQAAGVNALHCYIQEQDFGGDIAYPGCILYDENTHQLVAENLPG